MENKEYLIGDISRLSGHPVWRVEYVIRSRGVKPARRVGAYRVFSEESLAFITAELEKIVAGAAPVCASAS